MPWQPPLRLGKRGRKRIFTLPLLYTYITTILQFLLTYKYATTYICLPRHQPLEVVARVEKRNTALDFSATVLQYYSTAALQYYSTTVLQYYGTSVLQYYNAAVL